MVDPVQNLEPAALMAAGDRWTSSMPGARMCPFLEDETGNIWITDPSDALVELSDEFVTTKTDDATESPTDEKLIEFWVDRGQAHDQGLTRHRYREVVFPAETEIYAFGQAVERIQADGWEQVVGVNLEIFCCICVPGVSYKLFCRKSNQFRFRMESVREILAQFGVQSIE